MQGPNAELTLAPTTGGTSVSSGRRWAGLYVTSGCRRVAAAVLETFGSGIEARCQILAHCQAELPVEVSRLHTQLQTTADHESAAELGVLRASIAERCAVVVREVLADARLAVADVLALAVHDPGVWNVDKMSSRSCVSLCDAARLAALSDLNVVDAFPQRDLAEGGHGGPILAVPQWVLLHDDRRTRVLVDLGRSIRLAYLPSGLEGGVGPADTVAFDSGPGMQLIDRLTSQFSDGKLQYDPGGRLAVQGRKIAPLIDHWLEDRYFKIPPPRWHPLGVECDEALEATVRMAVDSNWSIRDLLCTGTHFIAESIHRAVDRYLPQSPKVDELVLTGGGQRNGLLLREISARFPDVQVRRLADLGIADGSLEPASVAMLAQFYVDQVPATTRCISGTETPRILGRLTPGSPIVWQRLIRELATQQPAMMSLRNAV